MKHLKIAITRTKGMPFACIMLCILGLVLKFSSLKLQGIGNTLVLVLILCVVLAIFDLIYAYMRDLIKD